jgi:hypothetical protein
MSRSLQAKPPGGYTGPSATFAARVIPEELRAQLAAEL